MRLFHRCLLRFVLAVVARPWVTLGASAIVLAVCCVGAYFRLPISTEQSKLFSSDVGFFRDYLRFNELFPENEALYVVVESRDAAHPPPTARWTAAADALTARLRAMPQHVKTVDAKVPLDQLGGQALLFEDAVSLPGHVGEIQRFAPDLRLWGEAAEGGGAPIDRFLTGRNLRAALPFAALRPTAEEAGLIAALAGSWTRALDHPDEPMLPGHALPDLAALGADSPRDLGYYYVPDESDPRRLRQLLLVRVYPKENFTALTAVTEIIDAIRGGVGDVAGQFPEFTFGTTGRPALDADEMRTSDHDSNVAEAVALSAVFVGLVVMFRSVWLAIAAELALGVGIGWTFGWATVSVGELNLLSIVFLIALIGIGMDYLVQVLMRYRRESARRTVPARIWTAVFRHIAPPINTACLGAAGAFFVAVFTHFKGAADLGIIAGGGLLLCLLAGYTVLPALLVIFPAKPRWDEPPRDATLAPAAREKRRRRRLVLPVLWIAALAVGVPFMLRAEFDPGLLNLQAPDLESVRLIRKLQTWSAVVLSKDLDQLRRVRQALQGAPTVASTESILAAHDNERWLRDHAGELPTVQWAEPAPVRAGDLARLARQSRSLAGRLDPAGRAPATAPAADEAFAGAAAALQAFADRAAAADADPQRRRPAADRLSAWQAGFVGQLRDTLAQFDAGPVRLDALPPELRDHLVSADGTYALYVYPKDDLWKRRSLAKFVRDVERRAATVPGAPAPTGIAINIFHSTNAIQRAFKWTTVYALALIFGLVLIDLRDLRQTLLAVSVLALGLPMLVAVMGWLDASWNFANFFGLPILIGAGHEYGVFMVHRYREALRDPRRPWRGWDVSDRALLLCAFITSSSFGFFWAFGHHEGLRSLGLVMAVGTACIYAATVAVLRPFLRWRLARARLRPAASGQTD